MTFKATSTEIFHALMDSKIHSKLTGAPAKISRSVGGKFSVYDGYAVGKNLEIVKDKKIVQTWRASDWPEGVESTVTFVFTPSKTGCTLVFTHQGVPADQWSSIKQGWIDFYWDPLKEMFKK